MVFYYIVKYILLYSQIYFTIQSNIFYNTVKYILLYSQLYFTIQSITSYYIVIFLEIRGMSFFFYFIVNYDLLYSQFYFTTQSILYVPLTEEIILKIFGSQKTAGNPGCSFEWPNIRAGYSSTQNCTTFEDSFANTDF